MSDTPFDFDAHFDGPNGPGGKQTGSGEVDPRLLEVLICPVTHGPLEYDRERRELVSQKARLAYPIRDGVPIMLAEEARVLES